MKDGLKFFLTRQFSTDSTTRRQWLVSFSYLLFFSAILTAFT